MSTHVVVGRELSFNVRTSNPATDTKHGTSSDSWKVDVDILFGEVQPVKEVVLQRLHIARPPTARNHVAVIHAEEDRRAKADVDVIGLHGIDLALDAEYSLVK